MIELFKNLQIRALDNASIVAITDQRGLIKYVNGNFCEISEYSREELIGKNHNILNSKFHDKSFFKNMWKTILTGQTWKGEIKNKSKSGKMYWVETTIIPFLNIETNEYDFISIRNEITDKKNAEELIKQNQLRLQHSDKMASLGILSAGISHEIGNPLSALSGRLEMLERQVLSNQFESEIVLKNIRYCLNSVDRMTRIIRALKAYARDGSSDNFVKVNLTNLIADILELTSEKAKKLNIEIIFEGPTDVYCECRESEIGQVLVNLINNSIDATKELLYRWIKIKLQEIDKKVKITITDSGTGIPKDILENIFHPFYTTKGSGTGLGLSISNQIVRAHAGTIEYNKNSVNTEFELILPQKQHQEKLQ